jgi:hypothetical protein
MSHQPHEIARKRRPISPSIDLSRWAKAHLRVYLSLAAFPMRTSSS